MKFIYYCNYQIKNSTKICRTSGFIEGVASEDEAIKILEEEYGDRLVNCDIFEYGI